jgi:hypothetical protein
MRTHDKHNRPWAKLSELKDGTEIELDGGFTCRKEGFAKVRADEKGELYFTCREERHYLSGQADDGEHCVGVYRL